MGAALKSLRVFFEQQGVSLNKRTLTSLFVLLVILIALPIAIYLIKQISVFTPRAAGELIQLGEGGCIKNTKDNKKVVDCSLVPLKLVNPFFDITKVTATPSATQTTNPTSSPPSGSSAVVNVKSFNNNIQAALDSIKTTGGAVYVPAGTYAINDNIRLFSNTTLFGDGIDQTIIDAGIAIDNEEAVVGNDTSGGQSNVVVRDMTIRGHPLGSGFGVRLRNLDRGHIHNVKVERVNTGILLGFHSGKGVSNTRVSNCQVNQTTTHGIFMSLGENNVIDNCTVDSGGSDSLGIGLEIGVEGKISNNRVISNSVSGGGHSLSFTAGNDNQFDPSWVNSNNIVCYNNAQGNKIQPIWDQRGTNNVYVGNNVNVNNVSSFGYEEKGGTDPRCDIPASYNIPAAPAKPIAGRNSIFAGLIKTALAQDSDDVFIDAQDSDSQDQFLNSSADNPGSDKLLYRLAESQSALTQAKWKEFAALPTKTNLAWVLLNAFFGASPALAQDSDDVFIDAQDSDSADQFINTTDATPSGSSLPGSSGTASFSIGSQFINTSFQLSDTKPGTKQIWVQFLHPDGTTRVDSLTFDLIDKVPQILGLACNLDISKENLKITIEGENFGNTVGTIETTAPSKLKPEVLGWNNKQIIGFLKKPNIPINEGQRFKVKLIRPDGFESGEAVCAVDKSLISLGARIFCREPGKYDAKDVSVTLLYNPEDPAAPDKINKVEEKVTINADGEIDNLKTKLQVDKNYAIAIKAPHSIRRTTTFTAQEGTTEILNANGTPFILPVGDIAPLVSPDGRINTLDRSELIRQWRILGQTSQNDSRLTGDFNRDGRVNSIDWACMNYDFGAEDDPIPTSVPQPASGALHIPGGEGTITIPLSSGSSSPRSSGLPEPSPSKDTSNSAKIDLGGKLFLDTNRNQVADIGESFISQGGATVKLLQVPEEHVIGTFLTAEELASSKTLAQVTNNLPGANYDISVFVEKDSGSKFSILATASSGQLTGTIDFELQSPLSNSNQVINIPVTSATQ